MVDRFHYVAPKIEVVSIGAGGGSIISIDPRTNVPSVGPKSAGARPGPICYGLGGDDPTVTDDAADADLSEDVGDVAEADETADADEPAPGIDSDEDEANRAERETPASAQSESGDPAGDQS